MEDQGEARGGPGRVQSVARAAAILRALAEVGDGASLKAVATRVGLPPSTTHRLLTTLEAEGFARADPSGGGWRVGVGLFAVGAAFARSRDLPRLARSHLRALMEATGETANLFVLEEGAVVCVAQVESRQAMRAVAPVGGSAPAHASGAGKALMAHLDSESRGAALGPGPWPRLTPTTRVDAGALSADLAEARGRGWALDDAENAPDMRCVAAAVFDEAGAPVAAVSISGPATRLPDDALDRFGARVARAAAAVTADYGGRGPVRDTE